MKAKDLKQKNIKELQTLLSEKTSALASFRFGVAGSNTRNVKEGNAIKKDIAKIKTILNLNK
jgi:ribosomal protein L29